MAWQRDVAIAIMYRDFVVKQVQDLLYMLLTHFKMEILLPINIEVRNILLFQP
jgi:hypothetical protein